MREVVFSLIAILAQTSVNIALPIIGNYSFLRSEILEHEQRMMIGANLTLNELEETVNKMLMSLKKKELDAAFLDSKEFAPAWNFISMRKKIERSKIYQFLQRMPKGGLLHVHDSSLVGTDYLYNVTFRDDMYVCEDNDDLRLHFFKEPDETCNWELLKKVRQDPKRAPHLNKRIRSRMTMVRDDPDKEYPNIDVTWSKFQEIFSFVYPITTYKPVYEDHFVKCLEELYKDNVMYAELRSGLSTLYDFDGTEYKKSDVVSIFERLTQRFKEEHPDFIGVKLIYAPSRSTDEKLVDKYLKTAAELQQRYPNFMIGFDLVGREDLGHTLQYFENILVNAESNVNFFFHAGETNWYGSTTDENLVDALLLNTRRIGHGYALTYHPFLLEILRRMNIAIEINPISNQVLKLVDDLRNHAARSLFAEGYPLVISSDDPGFWGAKALSHDFYEAFMALMSEHADLRALKQVIMNSFIYSSMTAAEKNEALALWTKKWDAFIKDVANEQH